MKIVWQIIAWLGILVIAISIPLAFSCGGYNVDMYEMGLFFTMLICAAGVFLFLIGGLISKGCFLWQIALIESIAYIAVLPRTWIPHSTAFLNPMWMSWYNSLLSAFAALVCIIGCLFMRWLTHRSRNIES